MKTTLTGLCLIALLCFILQCSNKDAPQKTPGAAAPAATTPAAARPSPKESSKKKNSKSETEQAPSQEIFIMTDSLIRAKQISDSLNGYPDPRLIKIDNSMYQNQADEISQHLESNPDDGNSYGQRGNARIMFGDVAGACADWKKAVSMGFNEYKVSIEKHCK
jgi:hypothetical protein